MMSMAGDMTNEYASGNNSKMQNKIPSINPAAQGYEEEEKGDNAGAMRAKGGNLQPGFAAGEDYHGSGGNQSM